MLLKKFIFSGILSSALFMNQLAVCADSDALHKDLLSQSSASSGLVCRTQANSVHPLNTYAQLAPTLSIMKMFLGSSFKPLPSVFEFVPNKSEYPAELYDNIKAFFGSSEFTPKKNYMGNQSIDLDDELADTICKLIRIEQEEDLQGNVVLYHGLDGALLFMYRYFSEIFSRSTNQQLPPFVLRGDHLYAINPTTKELFNSLEEVRKYFKVAEMNSRVGDYGQGIDVRTLHCNIALSVGPNTSLSTASSVGFLCNSFNARKYSIVDMITTALVFQGMPINEARKCATEAESFFKANFLSKTPNNGGILAISIPKSQIDQFAMHVCMNGREYNPELEHLATSIRGIFGKDQYYWISVDNLPLEVYLSKIDSSTDVSQIANEIKKSEGFGPESWMKHLTEEQETQLTKVLQEYIASWRSDISSISTLLKNISAAASNPSISRKDAIDLTNEIALYLHPHLPARIFGLFRHMPEVSEESKLKSDFEKLIDKHVEIISKSPFCPVDRALTVLPQVSSKEAQSGEKVPTKPEEQSSAISKVAPIDAIPFLIGNGFFEQAKTLIKQYPDFYKKDAIKALLPRMIADSVGNGFTKVADFLINTCGISLKKIIDEHEFLILAPELIQYSHQYYCDMVDILLNENLTPTELVSVAQFIPTSSIPKDYFDIFLNKCKSDQDIMEKIFIQQGTNRYFYPSDTVQSYIKHGFSFNPDDPIGKKHLDMLFEFYEHKMDANLAKSIAHIIASYKLDLVKYKSLYVLLASAGETYLTDRVHIEYSPTGYNIWIGSHLDGREQECDISFDDLDELPLRKFALPYGDNVYTIHKDAYTEALCKHLSKKFARNYPVEIYHELCKTKELYSFSRDYKAPVSLTLDALSDDTLRQDLKKAQSWNEIEKLVHDVKDVDTLFFNLKLLDRLADEKLIASGIEVSDEAREIFVNDWFVKLMQKSQKIINDATDVCHPIADASEDFEKAHNKQQDQLSKILNDAPKFIADQCHFYRWQQTMIAGKYAADNVLRGQPIADSDKKAVVEFFEQEIKKDPNRLKNDRGFTAGLLSNDLLPESITSDQQKLEEIFSMLAHEQQFYIALDLLKSDNPALRTFAESLKDKICYPRTKILMKDAIAILEKYNMLDHEHR